MTDEHCPRCGGTGLVEVEKCAADCRGLRHAPNCPVLVKTRCPMCAKAELGEDLA